MSRNSNQATKHENEGSESSTLQSVDSGHNVHEQAIVSMNQQQSIPLQVIDLTASNVPDLDGAQEIPFDLMADYWTPEMKNESKRVYFDCIKVREVRDQQDPTITIPLSCAYFFEKEKDKPVKTISNGSKRLVGLLEDLSIPRGTPLLITYLGKKKNATNTFSSDNWSVRPLVIKL